MAKIYYDNTDEEQRLQPGTTAKAEDVDAKFDEVAASFADAEQDIRRALKIPFESGMPSQEIDANAFLRRNRVVGFDNAGNLALRTAFTWRGNWSTGTEYFVNDVYRDPVTRNLYVVLLRHEATTIAADVSADRVALAINVEEVQQLRDETEALRDDAITQRQGAEDARDAADASEQAAAQSESNAAASEQAAAQSEANAASSEQSAAASEQAAAQSEANAASSEQAAASSEQNAASSEQAASTSESNAAASEQAASASAQDAAQSESNADASAQAAAQSEQNAAASESSVAQDAADAQQAASNAAQSESNADASAQAAATSEQNAAASEQNAAQSAQDAENFAELAADNSRLEVGTTTTGAPGTEAEVEIVGDPGQQLLNMTVPQGPEGEPFTATVSPTPPPDPKVGDSWINSTTGRWTVWVEDATSAQWVEFGLVGTPGPVGPEGPRGFPGPQGPQGDAGPAQAVADDLQQHVSDSANPHNVTAAQVGADPAGTAVAQVSAHATEQGGVHGIPEGDRALHTSEADASGLTYDNAESGLTAENVQAAFDETADETGLSLIKDGVDPSVARAVAYNDIGAPVAGGYFAGVIDTIKGTIQANDDYQTGLRYALIVAPKELEGGLGSSPAPGLTTGDLEWDTTRGGGEAGCFTRWNGLDATNVIIAKDDAKYKAHNYIKEVRDQYPAPATAGGSQWYLPALDELELLYRNFKPNYADNDTRNLGRNFPGAQPSGVNPSSDPISSANSNNPRVPEKTPVLGFREGEGAAIDLDRYWSTTDADEGGRAWFQLFTLSGFEGLQSASTKALTNFSVRPVRRVVL